jgi:signal transduction histidine kinase/DNA-binding LacI/PurR family transcriptional regulator
MRSRWNVALLTSFLDREVDQQCWRGISEFAAERDFNLVTFVGVAHAEYSADRGQAAAIYQLMTAEKFDGVAVGSPSVTRELPVDASLPDWFAQFAAFPCASQEYPVDGIPAVMQGDYAGMAAAVRHLVEVHEFQRIGFIPGPNEHRLMGERTRAYIDVMREHGIFDESLMTPPLRGWAEAHTHGAELTEWLLDEHPDLQAIVATASNVTIAAMGAISARGLMIPHDVALIGYDDCTMFRISTPPVTVVTAPLKEIGRRTALALLSMLDGGSPEPTEVVVPTLVVRESCGCPAASTRVIAAEVADAEPLPTVDAFVARIRGTRDALLRSIRRVIPIPLARVAQLPSTEERLLDGLISDLVQADRTALGGGQFVRELSVALNASRRAGEDLSPWQDVVTMLSHLIMPVLPGSCRNRADETFGHARVVISDSAHREAALRELLAAERAADGRLTEAAITGAWNIGQLADVVARELPRNGIRACYVALYDEPIKNTPGAALPEWARLVLAYHASGRVLLDPQGQVFRSREIVPAELLGSDRVTLVVLPLYIHDTHYGFVVFRDAPPDGALNEILRKQISLSVHAAAITERLNARATELEDANRAIQDGSAMLLKSEKMASLGRLTAGIAHEINTPLAAARAAVAQVKRLATEYAGSIDDIHVTAGDHHEISIEMQRSMALAEHGMERIAGFVRGIKEQTHSDLQAHRVLFDAVPVIRESLLLVQHALSTGQCSLQFDAPADSVKLLGVPGQLAQVITNLVTNAVDASPAGSTIVVAVESHDNGTDIVVSDAGRGIPPDVLPKIFDFLYTTKEAGKGTGLGLAIVSGIMTDTFAGSVQAVSEVGKGSAFTLHFPPTDGAR